MHLLRCLAAWTRGLGMVLLIAGCERGRVSEEPVSVVDSAGVRISTIHRDTADLPLWRLAPTPELVITGAESGDSAALSQVGPVRWLSGGSLVVGDLAVPRVLVYDSSGRYRRALGRRGAGPGEFRFIVSISALSGDTLTTYDGSLRRLTIWHPDTGFVRQISLTDGGALDAMPADAWIWRDTSVVVLQLAVTPRPAVPTGATVARWPMRASLTRRDTAGRVLRTSPDFEGTYTGIYATGDTRLPFANQPFVAIARDHVYFGSGAEFRLSFLGPDFERSGELRWPGIEERLESAEVKQVRDETYDLLVSRMPPDRAREAISMNFLPEILPKTRPAIGRVFVDGEGQLWVERFEALRLGSLMQKPGSSWSVLASDGRPVARVVLPRDTRLEAVRGDRVAVVQRDSLDVQTVAVYQLSKSAK